MLNLKGITINLFPNSKANNEGINTQKGARGIWSVGGNKFKTIDPKNDTWHHEANSGNLHVVTFFDAQQAFCNVTLPDDASVNKFGVFHEVSAGAKMQFWKTLRSTGVATLLYDNTSNVMANFNLLINNTDYSYQVSAEVEKIYYGAKIEYTY